MRWINSVRHPVLIQKPTSTQDATGGFVTAWETVRTPIAMVMEQDKSTLFNQEAYNNESVLSFQFRVDNRSPEIGNDYRIVYRGEVYQIDNIKRIGRNIVEVIGISIDDVFTDTPPWILAGGFWNREGTWQPDGFWIRDPQSI